MTSVQNSAPAPVSATTPTGAAELASGKGHRDENFPVASWLVRRDARAPVMTYYRFARASDDISDNAGASAEDKLRLLAEMRAGLEGEGSEEAVALGQVCRERGIPLAHAHDLLDAFVQDCTVRRYADWEGLIAYCRLSAMPVGRFVLDVHGEDRALWPMNDALCAALQVINHLQDCGKDYRQLDRVYIPEPMLAAEGLEVAVLGEARAPEGLLRVIRDLAGQTMELLRQSEGFAPAVRDRRLSAEVAVIQRLAVDLTRGLMRRDPLSERVHHGKARSALLALGAIAGNSFRRLRV